MLKINSKKTLYVCLLSIILFLILCIIAGIYFRDRRGGFIIGGNRIILNHERYESEVLLNINKNIVHHNAYQGIVYIAVSPQVTGEIFLSQETEAPIWTYELIFTNARRESFAIRFPSFHNDPRMAYVVLFIVGTEYEYRLIWKI